MNQAVKDAVYGKGTDRQVEFMAEIGGMNERERKVFRKIHEGCTDLCIQKDLDMNAKTYKKVEESVRQKLGIAIFSCINRCMDHKES